MTKPGKIREVAINNNYLFFDREWAVSENPVIWLVPGAGSIFLSPDHGHGKQLR